MVRFAVEHYLIDTISHPSSCGKHLLFISHAGNLKRSRTACHRRSVILRECCYVINADDLQKSKVEDQSPVTPTKPKPKPKAEAKAEAKAPETPTKTPVKTPVKTPAKTPSRKKAERVVEWKELPQADSGSSEPRPLQIKILVDGSFQASPINDKESSYFGQVIKLKAPSSFTAISTVSVLSFLPVPIVLTTRQTMITEGPNEGYQAILIRPARPFDFMKLTPEIRNRIYSYYFASVGVVDNPIVVDGKRSTQSKQPYAKTYCKGDTNRVALLAVSKEVRPISSLLKAPLTILPGQQRIPPNLLRPPHPSRLYNLPYGIHHRNRTRNPRSNHKHPYQILPKDLCKTRPPHSLRMQEPHPPAFRNGGKRRSRRRESCQSLLRGLIQVPPGHRGKQGRGQRCRGRGVKFWKNGFDE